MHSVVIPHHGGINRVKVYYTLCDCTSFLFVQTKQLGDSNVCAVWNDLGRVQLWNLTGALNQSAAMTGATQSTKLTTVRIFLFSSELRCCRKNHCFLSMEVSKKVSLWDGLINNWFVS